MSETKFYHFKIWLPEKMKKGKFRFNYLIPTALKNTAHTYIYNWIYQVENNITANV